MNQQDIRIYSLFRRIIKNCNRRNVEIGAYHDPEEEMKSSVSEPRMHMTSHITRFLCRTKLQELLLNVLL